MSSQKKKQPSAETVAPELKTHPAVRTVISLLLIIHLTAIAISITSNFYPFSELRYKLQDAPVLSQYMTTLNQHRSYNNHLTYGGGLDVDHFVELEIQPNGDSTAEGKAVVLNPFANAELPFLLRSRYQNLTLNMADTADDDELGGILPLSVSARLLKDQGVDSGVHAFRLKSLLLLDTSDYDTPTVDGPDPYAKDLYRTLYSAKIFDYDDKWLLNKAVAAGQTAPVRSLAPPKKDATSIAPAKQDSPAPNALPNDLPNKTSPAPLKKDS